MSPLMRRIPRELKNNFGRYVGIFLLITVAIAVTTGFLVAASSIKLILDDMRDTYTIEDFDFTCTAPAPEEALDAAEDLGGTVYENFYLEAGLTVPGRTSSKTITARSFIHREDVNRAAYTSGQAPDTEREIAIDRTFAEHNDLAVGDTVEIDGQAYEISGIMTLSDYQSLFEKNSNFVMNALTFTVAEVTPEGYERMADGATGVTETLSYSVVLDERDLSVPDRLELEGDMSTALVEHGAQLSDLTDSLANKSISYAADDVEGDSAMWYVMLVIIIVIMGFVFAVLTSSTIDAESAIIGTLLASGYRRRELLVHYLILSALVGLIAVALGNALGYAVLTETMKDLYYNSYSFPPYHSTFDVQVLLATSVAPLVLLVGTMFAGLVLRLRATPLAFLRSEKPGRKRRHGIYLPDALPFRARFQLRVIGRNLPNFLIMFLGITFASVLLMFGLCIMPVVENYAQSMRDGMVAEHIYTLKAPVPLADDEADEAEAFCASTLELPRVLGDTNETLTVYGIDEDSDFWDVDVSDGRVVIGAGAERKCGVEAGGAYTFSSNYTDDTYELTIDAVVDDPTDMNVYMSRETFNELFDHDADYFNGYVSDRALDIDSAYVASELTPSEMDKIVDQMRDSMGDMGNMLLGLALVIYLVIVYLLTKTVIDRAARAISYLKVFGYRSGEVNRLYIWPITAVVLISLVACIPFIYWALDMLCFVAFMDMDGCFVLSLPPDALAQEVAVGAVSYLAVAVLHVMHIRRVPLALALKVQE